MRLVTSLRFDSTALSSLLVLGVLWTPNIALSAPPVRSEDGSAELEALQTLGDQPALAVTEVETAEARGLEFEYGVALEGDVTGESNPTIASNADAGTDVVSGAEQSLVLRKARRTTLAGVWLTFAGVLIGPAFLAGAVTGANNGATTPAIVLGTISGIGFGFLATGIPLIVRGVRMRKHPDRYVDFDHQPRFVITTSGGGLTLRF
jgi:hypothetical protein